jgi:uncharacterized membrane protein (DUF2068 family)
MNKRSIVLPLSVLVLLALFVVPVAAAAGDVQVTLTADRNELAVGDPVRLTLEVTHPAGTQVIVPQLEQVWGELEVRSQSGATTTANDDGTETTRQTIEVTLFNLGEFETPELPLTISDGAGQVFEEVAPSVSLAVVPTLAEEDSELRDIKSQASLNVPAAWPWIAGGLALAVVAAIAGWWAYRRWQGKPFLAPAADNRPPWQVAYDELARIEGLGLLDQRRFKEYYTLVTDCLRTYLERQFDLSVYERTTTELKAVLRQSNLEPEPARLLLDLFAESDLVKFAKFTPDLRAAHHLAGEARELVTLTRPSQESELATFLGEEQNPTGNKPPSAPVATSQLGYESGR